MERIWAGWRSAYVADAAGGPPSECALCEVVNGQATEDDRLVVHADAQKKIKKKEKVGLKKKRVILKQIVLI
jgi:hypothetical protein